ncbi:MAG: glycosyltransferase family 2 protein [Cytophagales bacterium]|nr:glycosyltransferase family 2 protein [Cytophagales bacterium]
MLETLIWTFFLLVFYTYIGYGILLWILKTGKQIFSKRKSYDLKELPKVSFVVAAYNEEDCILDKIRNTFLLDYPKEKLQLVFVSDGSTDRTPELIRQFPEINHLHVDERGGKIAAIHRAMKIVTAPIVVFSDANTSLNKDAILKIAWHYADPMVGAVAGEKRVQSAADANAASSEGFYWKYESTLKQWDSELHSVVGAAGELFSVRTELYEQVPANAILDDFMISLNVARKGYVVRYAPEAYAVESSSLNAREEYKRKVRIASGGIQSIVWLSDLLNPFRYGTLSFQYVSHRVLRWTITPFALICLYVLSAYFVSSQDSVHWVYTTLFYGQSIFYLFALIGGILQDFSLRFKVFFIPYYFVMMNFSVFSGIVRYLSGAQSVLWEKAKRA